MGSHFDGSLSSPLALNNHTEPDISFEMFMMGGSDPTALFMQAYALAVHLLTVVAVADAHALCNHRSYMSAMSIARLTRACYMRWPFSRKV